MDRVHFIHRTSRNAATLTPTHAMKVVEDMRTLRKSGSAIVATGSMLSASAMRIRDTYRCRDARRDLRSLSLLGATAAPDDFEIHCADAGTIDALRKVGGAAA